MLKEEFENLRSQFVTSNWGDRRYLLYVFMEQDVAMLSSVFNSKMAIQDFLLQKIYEILHQGVFV